jgi:hypothetical protein
MTDVLDSATRTGHSTGWLVAVLNGYKMKRPCDARVCPADLRFWVKSLPDGHAKTGFIPKHVGRVVERRLTKAVRPAELGGDGANAG